MDISMWRLGQLQGGYSHTKETKLKMSTSHKASSNSGRWQKGQTAPNKGVPVKEEEVKQKLSKVNEKYVYTIFYTNESSEQTTNLKLYSIAKGWPTTSLYPLVNKSFSRNKYNIKEVSSNLK